MAAIGIGSMVGTGIFALLGQAVVTAGRDVYANFLIAGAIAFLSGLSYARLAAKHPVNGGIVEYLFQAFPSKFAARCLSLMGTGLAVALAVLLILAFLKWPAAYRWLTLAPLVIAGMTIWNAFNLVSSLWPSEFWRWTGIAVNALGSLAAL